MMAEESLNFALKQDHNDFTNGYEKNSNHYQGVTQYKIVSKHRCAEYTY